VARATSTRPCGAEGKTQTVLSVSAIFCGQLRQQGKLVADLRLCCLSRSWRRYGSAILRDSKRAQSAPSINRIPRATTDRREQRATETAGSQFEFIYDL